ncbi:MAG: paraquat-inducible membrane protein A [Rhodobacterales bacterium]|nr:MAG: paraquat-inducible membrane protein A [Rhodobacterales bacterium]
MKIDRFTLAKALNLALLVLFPLSWFAPLLHAGLNLPLFGTQAVSVVSGMQSLWETDVFLALLVTFLAMFAPLAKVIGMALVQFGLLRRKVLPVLAVLGKLAMADVFLVALYIVVVKGVHLTRVETGWGLYLFTFCVLASILLGSTAGGRAAKRAAARA